MRKLVSPSPPISGFGVGGGGGGGGGGVGAGDEQLASIGEWKCPSRCFVKTTQTPFLACLFLLHGV